MKHTVNFAMKENISAQCSLTGAEENVVLMDTISKRYSACGARIGAFVTKNKQCFANGYEICAGKIKSSGLWANFR